MKKLYMFLLLTIFVVGMLPFNGQTAKAVEEWPTAQGVAVDKDWTISFNKTIKNGISLADYIYVLDEQQQKVDVKLSRSDDNKQVIVKAPTKGYAPEKTYTLMILKGLPSQSGKVTKTTSQKQFTTTSNVMFTMYAKSYTIDNPSTTDVNVTVGKDAQVVIYDAQGQVKEQQLSVPTSIILLRAGEQAIVSYTTLPKTKPTATGLVVKETTEPAFTVAKLAKGGSVQIDSTSNFYRQVQALDTTQKAEAAYANYYTAGAKQVVQAATYKAINASSAVNVAYLYGKGQMIVSNEKDTPFTLYVPAKGTTMVKTNEQALTTYTLAAGENAVVTSTEPLVNNGTANHFEMTGSGRYHKAAYSTDVTTLADYRQDQTINGTNTENVYEDGETVIQNVGNTSLKLYGAAKFTTIQSTKEAALTYYTLLPLQTVKVTAQDGSAMRDVSIYDTTATGQYRTKQYVKNTLKDDRATNMQQSLDTVLIYKDGSTTITNTGGTTLDIFGPARYVQFEN